jgi:hypothetical protein
MQKQHILLLLCATLSTISAFSMEESRGIINKESTAPKIVVQEKTAESISIITTLFQLMTPPNNEKNVFNSEQMAQLIKD